MGSNEYLNLKYAEEFRVACTINNLRYEEVLQSFINHVSFYVFKGGNMDPMFHLATQVMKDCTVQHTDGVKTQASASRKNLC